MFGQEVLDELLLLLGRSVDSWSGGLGWTPRLGDGNKDNSTQSGERQDVGLDGFSEKLVSGTHC